MAQSTDMRGPTARAAREVQAAEAALASKAPPALAELLDHIHAVNPTGASLDPAERAERYLLKHRLQSAAIRHFGALLVVQAQGPDAAVVGLRHRKLPRDACHALVDELDDDGRAWVRFRLDTGEFERTDAGTAGGTLAATAMAPSARPQGPEHWLQVGRERVEAYDYEAARQAYETALAMTGGAAGVALSLVELLVDTLCDYEGAIALRPRIAARGRGSSAVAAHLGVAAVHLGHLELAQAILVDATGVLASKAWTLLAEAALDAGDGDLTLASLARARACAPPTPELLRIEGALQALRHKARGPEESALQLLHDRADWPGLLHAAERLLARYPDSVQARRMAAAAEAALQRTALDGVVQACERLALAADWAGVVQAAKAVPPTRWPQALTVLHERAHLALDRIANATAVQAVVAPWRAGQLDKALRALWAVHNAAVEKEVARAIGGQIAGWLGTLREDGRKIDESVDAVLAWQALLHADPGIEAGAATALCQKHPALQSLPSARARLDSEHALALAHRKQARRSAVAAVRAAIDDGKIDDAQALFEALGSDALPATEREEIAGELLRGKLWARMRHRLEIESAADNLIEAAWIAGWLADHARTANDAAHFGARASELRPLALLRAPWRLEVFAEGVSSQIPLTHFAPPELVHQAINRDGDVVIGTEWAGVLLFEVMSAQTSLVLRRCVFDGGDRERYWATTYSTERVIVRSTAGRIFEFDARTLTPTRSYQLPLPEHHELRALIVVHARQFWVQTGDYVQRNQRWTLFASDTLQPMRGPGIVSSDLHAVPGLEPPGLLRLESRDRASFVTLSGGMHPIHVHNCVLEPVCTVASPANSSTALVLAKGNDKGEKVPAVYYCCPGDDGTVRVMRWILPGIQTWVAAALSRTTGRAYALAKGGETGTLLATMVQKSKMNLDVNQMPITNACWLVASADGERAYVVVTGPQGTRVVAEPSSIKGQLRVRAEFPGYLPGYFDEQAKLSPVGCEALAYQRNYQVLDAERITTLWRAVPDPAERRTLVGQAAYCGALEVAEALLPQFEPRSAQQSLDLLQRMGVELHLEHWQEAEQTDRCLDTDALSDDAAKHHRHLQAFLAMMRGEMEQAMQRLAVCVADGPLQRPCACAYLLWQKALHICVLNQWSAEEQVLAAEMLRYRDAGIAVDAGDPDRALELLSNHYNCIDPNPQVAARLAAAWLQLDRARTPDEAFSELRDLAMFVNLLDLRLYYRANVVVLPGHHWSRQRLAHLREQAIERLRHILPVGAPSTLAEG